MSSKKISALAAVPLMVGVGASAGGLEAVLALLGAIPTGENLSFVVVFHLDPAAGSLLPSLLNSSVSLPVVEATDGATLLPDHVYTAPAQALLSFKEGRLQVIPAENPADRRAPIDHFFYALAREYGDAAVAIILSGTGSDGALGLKSVGEAGGFTLAQEPATARHDDMPQMALATGAVDLSGAPNMLAAELLAYAHHRQTQGPREDDLRREIADALPIISSLLLQATGHNFKHYKTSTLVRRTLRRVQVLRLSSAREYLDYLRANRSELEGLFQDLLIGVTAYFRDPEAFAALSKNVLPKLFENREANNPIRVWVPGCATGEEAYTLAILLREQLDAQDRTESPEIHIFATDIDEQSLATARQGLYPLSIAEELSSERLLRFFIKKNHHYHIAKSLREMVLFSVHNLINDPPFSKLDLISCRNLLIYLGAHLQKKLIPLFHYAFKPGGYLFLGPSENLATHRELFRSIDTKYWISQRLPTAVRPPDLLIERDGPPTTFPILRPPSVPQAGENDMYLLMQRIVLDEFAPKSVVVDGEGQIVCASGNLEKYLTVGPGTFQNKLVTLARQGLRVGLRAALTEAAKHQRRVINERLSVRTEAGVQRVMLTAQPIPQMGEESGLYLVAFQDLGLPLQHDEVVKLPVGEDAAQLIEQLERELTTTRADLEKTVQDLEAANEELKSGNEELLSMNEELQSANEELETSKEEVQAAHDALVRANTDLENLLTSTRIATLFLDDAGRVRRVTPAAGEIYYVTPEDTGRPLKHFTHRMKHMPPLPSAEAVRQSERPFEDEVEAEEGSWYLRRVLPYKNQEGSPEGIVITFTDITARKQAEAEFQESKERLRLALEAGGMATWDWNIVNGEVSWNDEYYRLLGHIPGTVQPSYQLWIDWIHPDDRLAAEEKLRKCMGGNGEYVDEFRTVRADGAVRWVEARGNFIRNAARQAVRSYGIMLYITERKLAEEILRRSEQRLALGIEVGALAIAEVDYTTDTVRLSRTAAKLYGQGDNDISIPRAQLHATFHPEEHEELKQLIDTVLQPEGEGIFAREHRVVWPSGEVRWLNVRKQVFFDHQINPPRPRYAILAARDVTSRKQAEEQLQRHATELATINAELARSNAELDAFAYIASHDLKEPLRSIHNYAQFL